MVAAAAGRMLGIGKKKPPAFTSGHDNNKFNYGL